MATEVHGAILGLYGGQALQDAGKDCKIVVYPDAGHAFHADYRPSYNAAAAEDGWSRLLTWFK